MFFFPSAGEPSDFDCSNLDRCKTDDEVREFAHAARNAAAVASYTFAVWCDRRAAGDPTPANIRQAKAAKEAARLCGEVGLAR